MDCPRCGAETHGAPECPRCGVVVRKARPPLPPRVASPPHGAPAWRSLVLPAIGLLVLVVAASDLLRRDAHPPRVPPTREGVTSSRDAGRAASVADDNRPPEVAPIATPIPDAPALAPEVPEADAAAVKQLVARLRSAVDLGPDVLRLAEGLFSRYPQKTQHLLQAVLLRTAQQERRALRYAAAAALLERALVVTPGSPLALRGLMALRSDQGDWTATERAARAVLSDAAGDAQATLMLAYALVRQDRTREAIELLTRYLDGHQDSAAAALLTRIQRDQAAEAGLGQQSLSHFHVRYDGATHEDVGREVLRVLERHYATLTQTLSHQPAEPIPVILLSEQSYYDSTGAPAWAGGHFDAFDGRVRIPIGGLTTSLDPALDETVLHELTHAFVADCSAGLAPRELQEGLAQFVAGHHGAARLDEGELHALATGRVGGVDGFYLASLAFVEDLEAQRGQGGINELLAAMSHTRSVDAAFREVYGKDMRSLQSEAMARLRQRYGG